MRKRDLHFWSIGPFALGLLSSLGTVQAQVVPDNTSVNSQVSPGGCMGCTVINGGTERGVNLYHSFREFSIPTGGEAYFNNAAPIQNILTRVTGASISNIDGLIRANGIANLYLLNPNRIVFGPNARLDIGGSFVATTANSFKLQDGSTYSAVNPQAPPLLAVNLTPGGQFGARPAGSSITNRRILTTGQDLTLNADKLDLQGQLQAGRDLTLQAQNTVQIRDTVSSLFVGTGGRDVTMLAHLINFILGRQYLVLLGRQDWWFDSVYLIWQRGCSIAAAFTAVLGWMSHSPMRMGMG